MTEQERFDLMRDEIIDLKNEINRLKEENEEYQKIKTTINEFWEILLTLSLFKRKEKPTLEEFAEAIQETKAEAYKEFAERLKENFEPLNSPLINNRIDNLLKEWAGDSNEN